MRTALFLLAGVCLLIAFLVPAKLFSPQYPTAPGTAFVAYLVVWLAVAAFNMWVGVAKAGYSTAEELPVFLLVFGVPAVIAGFAKWKLL